MEEIPMKLKFLAPSMNAFIGKLQNFNTLETAEKKTAAVRDILISIEGMRTSLTRSVVFFNNERQTAFYDQIERIFNEFNWEVNYGIKTYEFPKFIACCKSLAGNIMKMLGKRNCCILTVEMHFQVCIKVTNELEESIEHSNLLKSLLLFQLLIKGFLMCVKIVKKFWYSIVLPQQKCSIMLCLNQCFKTLCFLGKIIDKQLVHLIIHLLGRLKQCVNKIIDILFAQDEKCPESEFILLMDSCISKLDYLCYEISFYENPNKNSKEVISSLKPLLDELLCHAMIVSNISNIDVDSNTIKIYSQKVLDEYQQISISITDASGPDVVLRAKKLSEILCQLEQIVNTAILNIVLDVFIDINDPLKHLVHRCNEQEGTSKNKAASDLESEISSFDEHMDKIMHIGLFAVSCSTDVRRIVEIRSCLASLESLEAEVITCIVSLYLHPNPMIRKTSHFLFRNWMEEVTQLKNLIDLILDPAAFCQVVEKRVRALVEELKEDSVTLSKLQRNLGQIIRYTKKLIKMLMRCSEYEEDQNCQTLKEHLESLRLAFQECEASYSLLNQNAPPKEISERVTKRGYLIINSINALITYLVSAGDISENREERGNEFSFEKLNSQDVSKAGEDVYTANAVTQEAASHSVNVEVLTPYINKGKLRMKERTVLYNTPKNTQHFKNTSGGTHLRLLGDERSYQSLYQHTRSRCCRQLSRNVELENSLDLELTLLLDQVTDLSNTFKTAYHDTNDENEEEVICLEAINETCGPEEGMSDPNVASEGEKLYSETTAESDYEFREKVFVGTVMRRQLDQSLNKLSNNLYLNIDGDSNYKCETSQRLHDLTAVQQKINFLMEHIND